jgi:NADH-quinone oxidoreductase subunit N
MTFPDLSWLALLPTLIVSFTAMLVMVTDLWTEGPDREGLGWIGIVGLGVAGVVSVLLWNTHESGFAGGYIVDRYALFFNLVFCIAAALTLLASMDYLEATDIRSGEYYSLVLFATSGMLMMAAATDLIVIFLGLEVMSIAVYVLAGIWRRDLASNEAALKYFLLGAFASAFLLFGVAMFYGATGTTALGGIAGQLGQLAPEQQTLIFAGAALLLVGFGFKVAAVPFHAWTPDVYEGAPTSVTAFMAVGVKAAAFAAFARVFLHTLGSLSVNWNAVLWVLAVLTMTLGNVLALVQHNIKRMLAYSSIAHAGYLLVGMVAASGAAGSEAGGAAILYYLFVYAIMNLGAFSVVMALARRGEKNEEIEDYAGLGFKYPFLGLSMIIFMLSLAGFPTLAGFTGKFYLFSAAVKAGYIGLALIGVLNSVVSVYYYVGVLVKMYMTEGPKEIPALSERPHLFATLLVTATGTVLLGIFPSWAFDLARAAFQSLG